MVFSNKIQQTQTNKLVLTTNLIQSIKILNMSRLELEEEIENEAISNPLLDVEIKQNQVDWELYLRKNKSSFSPDKNEISYESETDYYIENLVKNTDSIYDSLHGQINIMYMEPKYKVVCNYIIDSLDKDGYLRVSLEEIAEYLHIDFKCIVECLDVVQSLEPTGVGARTLSECMIIQLKKRGMHSELLELIIENDLNLVANLDIKKLCSKYHIKEQDAVEYINIVKSLNPKPVELYVDETIFVQPDVIVELIDGKYLVKEFDEKRIALNINEFYKNLYLNTEDNSVKEYIKEKLNSAKLIINEINDRTSTIIRIAEEIIDIQEDYFYSNGNLKPMTLMNLADRLDIHPSTVSRGVNNKYMLTPRGLLEFKYFFSTSFKKVDGEVVSTNLLKNRIKEIIENEDKTKPFSDRKIELMLKEMGFDIARRTVTKYREELGYLSSSLRKKENECTTK